MLAASSSITTSTMSTSTVAGQPRTRQRVHKPAPELDVPDINQDASERKRVLNVLAQRRYRERKRQDRLKAKGQGAKVESQSSSPDAQDARDEISAENITFTGNNMSGSSPSHSQPSTDGGVNLMDLELTNWDSIDGSDLGSFLADANAPLPDFLTGQNPVDEDFSLSAFSGSGFSGTLSPSFGSPSSLNYSSSTSASEVDQFPDSFLLPVHELTILNAMMRIAARIGCDTQALWQIDCLSPFNQGLGTPVNQLPTTWQPTASQVSVPHHPVIDMLPWPSARDRMLMLLALPDESRPPSARGQLALINFVYDLEDNSEGVRIYGSDPCDPKGWEVGQVLFERWWFVFDREIIETSNQWRQRRGAQPLAIKGA